MGGKHSKKWVRVVDGANATGTEQSHLQAIENSEKLQWFKSIKCLPLVYIKNTKAWTIKNIFTPWLHTLNRKFCCQNKQNSSSFPRRLLPVLWSSCLCQNHSSPHTWNGGKKMQVLTPSRRRDAQSSTRKVVLWRKPGRPQELDGSFTVIDDCLTVSNCRSAAPTELQQMHPSQTYGALRMGLWTLANSSLCY